MGLTHLDEQLFRVAVGFPGKHPVSDRDTVIEELKAQGKRQEENQTVNKTNNTGVTENTETMGKQEETQTVNKERDTGMAEKTKTARGQEGNYSSTQKSNSIPFISFIWLLTTVLGASMYVRK
ncbi:hypothetical protein MSHOH_1739 [Methanosarcina horonobensis HB-1 = JCM 15518]|uniref:Uncharacterized protein n=1 Tax=Methanosarcina horonobensis HB-1 = JCM 15518 TaxID=1434110 RepID=A0A0E3SDN5_9EURY|nr:hypothetical protein [Methanosarcina horonobensis]AKB78222.1 hypothetical protein MSHOH_1739 [Methanosarcina horonobensis HB-1 = JCM 15518]